jgi:hypothetical protein
VSLAAAVDRAKTSINLAEAEWDLTATAPASLPRAGKSRAKLNLVVAALAVDQVHQCPVAPPAHPVRRQRAGRSEPASRETVKPQAVRRAAATRHLPADPVKVAKTRAAWPAVQPGMPINRKAAVSRLLHST